jgi:hypothetical protein
MSGDLTLPKKDEIKFADYMWLPQHLFITQDCEFIISDVNFLKRLVVLRSPPIPPKSMETYRQR